jgi:hypothetical protein
MVKDSVKLVKPKNLLKVLIRSGNIIDYVVETVGSIPDLEKQKFNISLIRYICEIVENTNGHSKPSIEGTKVNKKDVVFTILQKLFPSLSENDKLIIDGIIEDLHSSGRIKKVKRIWLLFVKLRSFFLK